MRLRLSHTLSMASEVSEVQGEQNQIARLKVPILKRTEIVRK